MFQAHNNRKKGQPPQTPKRFIRGQNIIEYMILVVGVVTVVVVATRPQGFFTQGVNQALNLMFSGVDKI
ncbi:MAG: hypothetical protein HZA28_03370, partial [Candidatus Omnitrophica bacterium]|nr:hypothetical protein [Candidatus Omnitrophota bacterium]